jgi:transcriptional regulator with XRE-family HTH domain
MSQKVMPDPGHKLRAARERLQLRYRDVEEASQLIADQRGNHEFSIGLSRLADIENKGTVPSLFRLYSLCAIYRIDFSVALRWYGIELEDLASDAASFALEQTHLADIEIPEGVEVDFPTRLDKDIDLRRTSYLARHIRQWGKLPLALLNTLNVRKQRYAFIGTADWSMYPIVPPGSLVQVDESKRYIARDGWSNEYDRPIYLVEHRSGFRCGWCTAQDDLLVVVGPAASQISPSVFRFPGEADVIGQVVAVAMRFDQGRRRHISS